MADYSLSFVIPLYNSAQTIGAVVKAIEALTIEGGHEIILVNDGSQDETDIVARALVVSAKIPVTYISHARILVSTMRYSQGGGMLQVVMWLI